MDQKAYWTAAAAAGISLLGFSWRISRRNNRPPFPPGPPRDPIIGNLRTFPQAKWQETFSKLQETYGGLIYFKVLGQSILVINSLEAARDLLDKRGNIYSGRPQDVMNYTIMGWDWNVVLAQPGPFHSECRTIFRKAMGQQEMDAHRYLIQEETRNLIPNLADVRGDPYEVLIARVGAVIIRLTYGDSVYREHGQELVDLNHETLDLVTSVSTQFWLVNFIPILRYLPDWLPLSFKKTGKRGLALQKKMHFWAWEQVEKHHKEGIAGPSIALQYLESNENVEVARDALGMMYSAGVENPATTLASFVAIMLLHPEEQKKIQAELDDVLHGVLPEFRDRDSLPILDAAWRESIRLHPSTPLGIPHLPQEDDVYKNMYIQRSIYFDEYWVGFNSYMCRDPTLWDEPDVYRPERWLLSHNPNARSLPNLYDIVFGFGRRICPGLFLADQTGFTFAAAILQAYDIVPVQGESMPKFFAYQDAIISRPEGVRCQFRRRA